MAYTTIDDPSAYFQTTLYTGNGSANLAITNSGNSDLQPDLVWIKNRDTTDGHCIFDSNRGATKLLAITTAIETTDTDTLDSFASDGFQVDADVKVNTNTEAYIAWQWKANGGTTSTNTSGTNIDTTVQANTTAGFSIMTYDGTGTAADSLGHGLGVVPHLILLKNLDEVNRFMVYHHKNTAAPETEYLNFQATNVTVDVATRWNDTAPTSTVITLGDNDGVSKASTSYICYAWSEIQGFSKFGSYIGNGNADGPFVYTGFKPAFVTVKKTTAEHSWYIQFISQGYNPVKYSQIADQVTTDATESSMDFCANGFKLRTTGNGHNTDDETYVYIAFAENPFVTSGGVPCTAR